MEKVIKERKITQLDNDIKGFIVHASKPRRNLINNYR